MLGYDEQFRLANAMAKSFADATTTMMRATASLWPADPVVQPGRSWYRPPAPNPFDLGTWFSPFSAMAMPWGGPWAAWGTPLNASMIPAGYQPWSALASFTNTMAAFESAQSCWASFVPAVSKPPVQAWPWQAFFQWPMATLDAINKAGTQGEFANFRSTGGHAAAPISLTAKETHQPSWPKLH
jgi:hypothetical protein